MVDQKITAVNSYTDEQGIQWFQLMDAAGQCIFPDARSGWWATKEGCKKEGWGNLLKSMIEKNQITVFDMPF